MLVSKLLKLAAPANPNFLLNVMTTLSMEVALGKVSPATRLTNVLRSCSDGVKQAAPAKHRLCSPVGNHEGWGDCDDECNV